MNNLSPLIEKIEAAEEGSYALTKELLDAVDPNLRASGWMKQTESIDAIVGLIESELPNHEWIRTIEGSNFLVKMGAGEWEGEGATTALALCAAFLKALQSERGGE